MYKEYGDGGGKERDEWGSANLYASVVTVTVTQSNLNLNDVIVMLELLF